MKWMGKSELVIGEVDDFGNVITEYRIKSGEEIPLEAEILLSKEGPISVDHKGNYSKELIKDAIMKD